MRRRQETDALLHLWGYRLAGRRHWGGGDTKRRSGPVCMVGVGMAPGVPAPDPSSDKHHPYHNNAPAPVAAPRRKNTSTSNRPQRPNFRSYTGYISAGRRAGLLNFYCCVFIICSVFILSIEVEMRYLKKRHENCCNISQFSLPSNNKY